MFRTHVHVSGFCSVRSFRPFRCCFYSIMVYHVCMYVVRCVSDTYYHMKPIFVGETAHLSCGDANTLESPVDWLYRKSLFVIEHLIVSAGKLINGGVGGRFDITGNTLIINNVTTDDNGIYTCVEDTRVGKQHRVVLGVQGNFRDCIFTLRILKPHCHLFRQQVTCFSLSPV